MKSIHPIRSYKKMYSFGAVAGLLIAGWASNPPIEQMAGSKVAVSIANSEGGNEYAPLELKSAMEKMDAAEKAMSEKNYPRARQLAEEAQVDAQLAATTARAAKAQKAANALQKGNRVLVFNPALRSGPCPRNQGNDRGKLTGAAGFGVCPGYI